MKFMDILAMKAISSSFRLEILNNHCRELALPHHHNCGGEEKKKKTERNNVSVSSVSGT